MVSMLQNGIICDIQLDLLFLSGVTIHINVQWLLFSSPSKCCFLIHIVVVCVCTDCANIQSTFPYGIVQSFIWSIRCVITRSLIESILCYIFARILERKKHKSRSKIFAIIVVLCEAYAAEILFKCGDIGDQHRVIVSIEKKTFLIVCSFGSLWRNWNSIESFPQYISDKPPRFPMASWRLLCS